MDNWACDFETTTDENDCRVWCWGACNVETLDFVHGTDIEDYIRWLKKTNGQFWFHNLAWDGEFILSYLLKSGWEWTKDKLHEKNFTTLISDLGEFYELKIHFKGKNKIIHDSFKVIPFSIEAIGKQLGDINKLHINYDKKRPVGYIPDSREIDYLKHDVVIQARALKAMFSIGGNKMTIGSNALHMYKAGVGKYYKYWFPPPQYDADIRQSYKGGYVYVNPKYKGKIIGKGVVYDVNSLYPYVMYSRPYPVGEPIFFEGAYIEDKTFPLYIVMFRCCFELKEGYLPTIQLKGNLNYVPTEYVTSSEGRCETLCLTSVDLKLFLEHYDVWEIEYLSGYKFKAKNGIFTDYIEHWTKKKIEYEKAGNMMMRTICKLYLNNLYGKFATNPVVKSKIPIGFDDDGKVAYKVTEPEERKPVYLPVGSFVTAWARDYIIRAAQKNYDRFIYCDTDSLHLRGTEDGIGIEIDSYKIGAFKLEKTFTKAKYLRAKTYLHEIDGKRKVTCAGMPDRTKENVTFDNFNTGTEYGGKLTRKRVSGGVILKETTFRLRKG